MRRKKAVIFLLILSLVMIGINPLIKVYAEEPAKTTIKVGYMDYPGFIEKDADGEYSGYMVEYLEELSKYTGYTYEYVKASWSECLSMLKTHEIDIVCNAQYSAERAKEYQYSKQSIGTIVGCMYASKKLQDVYYNDYETFDGKTIGFIDQSINAKNFEEFEIKNNFLCDKKYYKDSKALMAALDSGEVDFIGVNSIWNIKGYELVANYNYDNCYVLTYDNEQIIDTFNKAMPQLDAERPEFRGDLYQKYYGTSEVDTATHFTREEAEYIENAPVFKVAVYSNSSPLAYEDDKTGDFVGIEPGILDKIAEISGLKFEYVQLENSGVSYSYDYFRENKIDLIAGIEVNKFNENTDGLILSNQYFSSNKVLVGRNGETVDINKPFKIAISGSSGTLQYVVAERFPNAKIIDYKTLEECLDAVLDGKADTTLYNEYMIDEALRKPRYEKLAIIPNIVLPEKLSISPVLYSEGKKEASALLTDERLMSIINKSIKAMGVGAVNEIVRENTIGIQEDMPIGDFLYKYRAAIISSGILLIVIGAIIVINGRNKTKVLKKLEISNEQLKEAVNNAENANQAKSAFLSRMSHEIRTPMNAIIGMTSLAARDPDDSKKVMSYLGKIASSSKILLNLINDILDLSAIENNKMKIAYQEFDLKDLLFSINNVYYTQCEDKGVEFKFLIDPDVDEMMIGDALRVNQILLNIVSNAYKFTDRGGNIRISVSKMYEKEEQVYIRFEISDTGIGMTPDMKSRLFHSFEQESATTAQKHGGTGLGMAITKNLIDLMHGAVNVESEKGKGTTFKVDIPFGKVKQKKALDPDKFKNIKALIIDDDSDAREYTAAILERIGIHYDFAKSGEEAEEVLINEYENGDGYDVCFIDWKLPGISGIDVTRKIREEFDDETFIIIVSAYDLSEAGNLAEEAGANAMVPKPLFQSTVCNLLLSLSGGKYTKVSDEVNSYDFTGKKIMLAEDVAFNAEIAMELLKMVHMEVVHVENGQLALDTFKNEPAGTFDAILMDIQMPLLDGYEATRLIRQSGKEDAATIPIFAMTANAFAEDVAEAISNGMNGHIAKPVDSDLLYKTLKEAIK